MIEGHSITLAELEQHLNQTIQGVIIEEDELFLKYKTYVEEISVTDPFLIQDGIRVPNERYQELTTIIQKYKEELSDIQDKIEFIKEKITELAELDNDPLGLINKEKDRIVLTANDCILLNIEVN